MPNLTNVFLKIPTKVYRNINRETNHPITVWNCVPFDTEIMPFWILSLQPTSWLGSW